MDYIQHFGIEGMQWGKRRWQYPDGRFNEEGKERYFGRYKKQVDANNIKIKDNRDIAERYKAKSIVNKSPFYRIPISKIDNLLYKMNNKKVSGLEKQNILLKDKFINNLRKIKIDDQDTLEYRKIGEMFQKDINNYINNLISDQNKNKTYTDMYSGGQNKNNNNNNNNNKNNLEDRMNKIINSVKKTINNTVSTSFKEINKGGNKGDKKQNKPINELNEKDLKKYIRDYIDDYFDERDDD